MEFQDKIEEFRLYVPLIQGLHNPGMRNRHWKMLSEDININIKLEPSLTIGRCLEMNLLDHIESITKVAEIAGKEYAIENVRREGLAVSLVASQKVSIEQAVIALGNVPIVPEHQTHSAAQVKKLLLLEKGAMATQLSSHTRSHFTLCRISVVA